jgi:glycerol-3-phosphate dehydrogenase
MRSDDLDHLANAQFDAIVVGGGINGAIATLALATHGARVACIERNDFASATSQESSNLVWGGFKYLEGYDIPLVAGLCASRNRLAKAYPNRLVETRFLATLDRDSPYPPWFAAIGSFAYWFLGRFKTKKPRYVSVASINADEPSVSTKNARGGIEYSDYRIMDNDARFVSQFLFDAVAAGATICNYTELKSAERANGTWQVTVEDRRTGKQLSASAPLIVNAGGPYLAGISEMTGSNTRKKVVLSKGIHLIVPQISDSGRVLAFYDDKKRLFYVLPMGHRSVVGTTDSRTEDPEAGVTDEERLELLAQINKRLKLVHPLELNDIIAERVGVRPLVVDSGEAAGEKDWTALSRRHAVEHDEQRGVVSILGGKLSDCLNVGAEVVEAAEKGGLHVRKPATPWFGEPTASERAAFCAKAEKYHLSWKPRFENEATHAEVLWRRYGVRAWKVLSYVEKHSDSAASMMGIADYCEAEIHVMKETELIVSVEDFLRRRTLLAQLNRPSDLLDDTGVQRAINILLGDAGRDELRTYCQR